MRLRLQLFSNKIADFVERRSSAFDKGWQSSTLVREAGWARDNMYGFSSKAWPGIDSAYWLDAAGYHDVQTRYQDPATGNLDIAEVKEELALPRYNNADTVLSGELTEEQALITLIVRPATESVMYVGEDRVELIKVGYAMTGVVSSSALPKVKVVNSVEHVGP